MPGAFPNFLPQQEITSLNYIVINHIKCHLHTLLPKFVGLFLHRRLVDCSYIIIYGFFFFFFKKAMSAFFGPQTAPAACNQNQMCHENCVSQQRSRDIPMQTKVYVCVCVTWWDVRRSF